MKEKLTTNHKIRQKAAALFAAVFSLLATGLFAVPACSQPVAFTLPPGAKVAAASDARGWQANGTIALSFAQAKARLGTAISGAGWSHLHTIELSKDRVLEAWSRGGEELTVMIWRLAPGKSGFSYGLSKKATAGKADSGKEVRRHDAV